METKGKAVDSVIQYQLHRDSNSGKDENTDIAVLYPMKLKNNTRINFNKYGLFYESQAVTFNFLVDLFTSKVLIYQDGGVLTENVFYQSSSIKIYHDSSTGMYYCDIITGETTTQFSNASNEEQLFNG